MCLQLVCFQVNLPLTSMQLPPQSSTKERFSDVMRPPSFKAPLWDWGKFYNDKPSVEHKFIMERVINSTHLNKLHVHVYNSECDAALSAQRCICSLWAWRRLLLMFPVNILDGHKWVYVQADITCLWGIFWRCHPRQRIGPLTQPQNISF